MRKRRSCRTAAHATTHRAARLVASGVVAALAGACLGDAPIITTERTRDLARVADSAQTWNASGGEPITVRFDVPSQVPRNRPLAMRLTLHNAGTVAIPLGLRSGRTCDVVVAMEGMRADSGAAWSLEGEVGSVTGSTPLAAGRDTTFSFAWTGQDDMGRPVLAGRYRARARVAAPYLRGGQVWTAWAPFEVTAAP